MIIKPLKHLNKSKRRLKLLIVLVTVLLIVLNIMFAMFNSTIFNFCNYVLSPMNSFGTRIQYSTIGLFSYFGSNRELTIKNKELEQINAELEQKIVDLRSYEMENANLRSILDLKLKKNNWNFVAAEVTAQNTENWRDIIIINKGTNDGLRENQPVLTPVGLVGHIISIGLNFAKVQLITDSQSKIGASLLSTSDIFLVEGNAKLQSKKLCKLTNIYQNINTFVGDLVVTSGIGSVYPKGIVIGKIVFIQDNEIILKPAVDFSNLEHVMIITKVN